jgi:hypothetical protein
LARRQVLNRRRAGCEYIAIDPGVRMRDGWSPTFLARIGASRLW